MKIQQAVNDIKENHFSPIYLVLGKETYLAGLFQSELQRQIIKTEDDQLNFAVFDMEEVPLHKAIEECETIPFFGEYRLIYIVHPFFLTSEKNSSSVEHNVDDLISYLQQPLESTILVLLAPYEKLDERKKVVKQLKKVATVIESVPMKEQEVQRYLQEYIKNEGYSISREALELFLRLTDAQLARMMTELNKLMVYASDTKKISKQAVEELIPKALEHNIFDISDFILGGKTAEALNLYHELLLQGEEPLKINSILINQFRLLLQTKILMENGYQQSNIVETLKVHPYRVKLAIQQIKLFSLETLGQVFDQLVENDYNMKIGKMNKELLFEFLILKISQKK